MSLHLHHHPRAARPSGRAHALFALALALGGAATVSCDGDNDPQEPKVEPPPRELVTHPLFGLMPVDNRFLNPQFAAIDGVGWMCWDDHSRDYGTLTPLFYAGTPGGQPTLLMPDSGTSAGTVLVGRALSVPSPMQLSIWVGRSIYDELENEVGELSLLLAGADKDGETVAVELTRDEVLTDGSGARVTAGEAYWYHYSLTLDDGPVGMAFLVIDNIDGQDLFLTAPVLTERDSLQLPEMSAVAHAAPPKRVVLTEAQRRAIAESEAILRQRF